jgi:cell division protein FtsN
VAARKKTPPKRGASRYQGHSKKPIPGWLWLACGLAIGAFVVLLMKLEPGDDKIKRVKPEVAQKAAQKAATDAADPVKPKYDFYTLLPESEVIVPPDSLPATPVTPEQAAKIDAARAVAALNGQVPPPAPPVAVPAPAPPANAATLAKAPLTTQYFLQAGSFRKQADADRVRAQIILLGQAVQVESGTVRDEVWYRVLVGPFASKAQLAGAQKQLAASGFGNLLLQQRQVR